MNQIAVIGVIVLGCNYVYVAEESFEVILAEDLHSDIVMFNIGLESLTMIG